MLPDRTFWPPKRFTPSRLPAESRPLLEDDQVRPTRLLDDRAQNLGAGNRRRADLVAHHQHIGEFDRSASFARDPLDGERVVGRDRVLFSTRADNGDHEDT
jgi:hypothetical protein